MKRSLEKDEWGLTWFDWQAIWDEDDLVRHELQRRALKALWCKPVVSKVRSDGVICHRDGRGDDWTLGRALLATLAIFMGREWHDGAEARWGPGHRHSRDMAFWDGLPVYGGHTVEVLWLYAGCHFSIFNDGETSL